MALPSQIFVSLAEITVNPPNAVAVFYMVGVDTSGTGTNYPQFELTLGFLDDIASVQGKIELYILETYGLLDVLVTALF